MSDVTPLAIENPSPLPSTSIQEQQSLAVVVSDDTAIVALINQLLRRAGITQAEICRRLGISSSNFNQYRLLRRRRPSVWWLARLATACGARLILEFPSRPL